MAKSTRVSRDEYRNLAEALGNAKRSGKAKEYDSPAVTARLLLEAFIFEDGEINADWFVRENACSKGAFTKLRDRLVEDNWLHFREDTKRYFPGIRLKNYLEIVKAAKAVTFADLERKADKADLEKKADKSEFNRVADDVQDLKAQMHEVKALLAELKSLQAPPPSAEAQQKSAEITARLERLLNHN